MGRMTEEAARAFMRSGSRTGKLATVRPDGSPHVVPVWFDYGGRPLWSTRTCRRYVGDDRADEFGRRNAVPGESVVRVRPTRLMGETGVAD